MIDLATCQVFVNGLITGRFLFCFVIGQLGDRPRTPAQVNSSESSVI